MEKNFKPIATAEGWQLSNPSILDMAAHRASIDIFDEAGFENLISKSKQLTGFTFFVLQEINKAAGEEIIKILTPLNKEERGCQISILINKNGKQIFDALKANGVLGDWREPNVIRVAPAPLYNSYEDVYVFGNILEKIISNLFNIQITHQESINV